MPVPPLTVEEFAARLRGTRSFGSDARTADAIRVSELVAAAAVDYCRLIGFSGLSRPHHQRVCANYCAAQLGLPPRAVGMPPFLIALLFGLATKLAVELIWKAAALVADWLQDDDPVGSL